MGLLGPKPHDKSDVGEIPQRQKQVALARDFEGMVSANNFVVRDVPVESVLGEGDVLVKNLYLSMDPYLRLEEGKLQVDQKIQNWGAGLVVRSSNKKFKAGAYVRGFLGWEDYSLIQGAQMLTVVPHPTPEIPLSYEIGILGMTGETAYHGLHDLGNPKADDTVFISAASGAVGAVAGQLAKLKGCRVVGSAGSDEKVRYIKDELGFDAAFNYKTVGSLEDALGQHCPKGIDVYFDNVGGITLDAVLGHINKFGRIVACGMIVQYNKHPNESFKNLMNIVLRSVRMEGFLIFDAKFNRKRCSRDVRKWVKSGKLKYKEHITTGLENAPTAFAEVYQGKNFGKSVIKVDGQ